MSDTFTVGPPGGEGDGAGYRANTFEWIAATLNKGDNCWFRKSGMNWKPGTFVMTYFYDGIIARVYEHDPDDYIEYSLFLDLGDQICRWEVMPLLKQWEALTS